jgi:hypothetical protein
MYATNHSTDFAVIQYVRILLNVVGRDRFSAILIHYSLVYIETETYFSMYPINRFTVRWSFI